MYVPPLKYFLFSPTSFRLRSEVSTMVDKALDASSRVATIQMEYE